MISVTDPPSAHVRDTDAFTLRMERDPLLRSTITAVAVFDQAPDWAVLVDRIERATRLVPAFRARLAPSPLSLAPPRWVLDPDFDLSWHLRRIECAPGHTLDEVFERAQVAATSAFDPARPLWRFTLFEGLPDGRAALLMKVHHALTDGIGGIELAAHVVDFVRDPQDLGPLPPAPRLPTHHPGDDLTEAATFAVRRWTALAGSVAGALPGVAARTARSPRDVVSEATAAVSSIARFVRPVTSTMSPVMQGRSLRRRFVRHDLDLEGLRKAASTRGATLNDAFLTGVTGGMREYHLRHGVEVDALRLTLPISLREAGDAAGGNRVTLARIELPVDLADPVERMGAIGQIVRAAREEPALRHSEGIASMFNLLPAGVTGGMLKHVDLVATNVPGFPADIYVGGALVEAFYPFAPTIGTAANIGLLSYRGVGHVGMSIDPAAVPDPEFFAGCLADGFDEVIRLA
jgi:diacylglycerol O-acyltransferase / wax synthase